MDHFWWVPWLNGLVGLVLFIVMAAAAVAEREKWACFGSTEA